MANSKVATTSGAPTARKKIAKYMSTTLVKSGVTAGLTDSAATATAAATTTERMKKDLPRCLTTATRTTTYDCDPGNNDCDDDGTD